MALFGSSWNEGNEDENIGPFSHWKEEEEEGDPFQTWDDNLHNGKTSFTIEEIKNYIISQDSLGDVLYNLSSENIKKANK